MCLCSLFHRRSLDSVWFSWSTYISYKQGYCFLLYNIISSICFYEKWSVKYRRSCAVTLSPMFQMCNQHEGIIKDYQKYQFSFVRFFLTFQHISLNLCGTKFQVPKLHVRPTYWNCIHLKEMSNMARHIIPDLWFDAGQATVDCPDEC